MKYCISADKCLWSFYCDKRDKVSFVCNSIIPWGSEGLGNLMKGDLMSRYMGENRRVNRDLGVET
jgi:hypothetical protein